MSLVTWQRESFAFAGSFDEAAGRYRRLRVQDRGRLPDAGAPGLLVPPAAARPQLDADVPPRPRDDLPPPGHAPSGTDGTGAGGGMGRADPRSTTALEALPRRRTLEATRVGRDATQIADEVIATSPTPDHVVRTVTENNRRLNVTDQGFERE